MANSIELIFSNQDGTMFFIQKFDTICFKGEEIIKDKIIKNKSIQSVYYTVSYTEILTEGMQYTFKDCIITNEIYSYMKDLISQNIFVLDNCMLIE